MWWAGVLGDLLDGFEGSYDWSQLIKRPDPHQLAIDRLLARLPAPDGARPHPRVAALAGRISSLPEAGLAWLAEELHNLGGNPLVRERLATQLPPLVEPRLRGEGAVFAADVGALLESMPEARRAALAPMLALLALLVACELEPPLELPATSA
jgi:hypothetical protein